MKINGISQLFAILFIFASANLVSCQKQSKSEKSVSSVPGEIQVLNACGKPGAAQEVRVFLMENGFDVVESGNADYWNYQHTTIAVRNKYWLGAEKIAKTLKTDKVVYLEKP